MSVKVMLQVLAVKDSAVDAYARPIFVPSLAVGIRSFTDEVNRAAPDNQMYVHPEDFVLVHLAEWDEDSGGFISVDPRVLCRAKDIKRD